MKKKKNKNATIIQGKGSSAGEAKSSVQKRKSSGVLFFDEIYENGMIRDGDRYVLCYSFSNIDYLSFDKTKQDNIYEKYQELLNSLPCDMTYQELLMNREYDRAVLESVLISENNNLAGGSKMLSLLEEDYKKLQKKRINECVRKECTTQLVGVISYTPNGKLDSPDTLFQYYESIEKTLDEINVKTKILTPEEILGIYHDIYQPDGHADFRLPQNLYKHGMALSDYVSPSHIRLDPIKYIETGSNFGRVMYLKRFSRDIDDSFLSDLLDHPYKITVSKHIRRLDKDESAQILKNNLDALEGQLEKRREINSKRGSSYIPYRLRDKEKEIERIQEKLAGTNCDLFEAGLFIYFSAGSKEELEDLTKYLQNLARKHQCVIDALTRQQEKGLKAILPIAKNSFNNMSGNNINFFWLTDELANLIPFSSIDYIDSGGFCYGRKNKSNKLLIIDRTKGLNANGFVFGASGSGKSFFVKATEMIPAMFKFTDDEFIIIDPENEYKEIIEKFGGTIVSIAPDSPTHINLFDTDLSFSENGISALSNKKEFIMMVVEQIKGEQLSASERSMVNRCVTIAYQSFLDSNGEAPLPTLQDFWNILKKQNTKVSDNLCDDLELYISGSFDMFAHHTNIEYNNRFMLFDINNMGGQLQTVGMQILLELVWQRVRRNKENGVRTWVWIDEFVIVLNDEKSSAFFETVYQRIRKYGGVPTALTQNISRALTNSHAMNMLKNSEFVVFLREKEDDLKYILDNYKLSPAQKKLITSDEPGRGLIIAGNKIVEFENKIPKTTMMYKVCQTTFGEDKKLIQRRAYRASKNTFYEFSKNREKRKGA